MHCLSLSDCPFHLIRLIEEGCHGEVADQSAYANRQISAYALADKNV